MIKKICNNCGKGFEIENWRLKDPRRGRFCSILCNNKYHSGERSHYWGRKLLGKEHPSWRGDAVSYVTFHTRVKNKRGKPNIYEMCGTISAKRFEWANLNGKYEDVNDYKRLCVKCHRELDGNMPINRYIRRRENYASL